LKFKHLAPHDKTDFPSLRKQGLGNKLLLLFKSLTHNKIPLFSYQKKKKKKKNNFPGEDVFLKEKKRIEKKCVEKHTII